jgi:hypothetical protein
MTYMPPPKNLSFLERLGLQKQDESAEGETAQKFYNRSRFGDTLARLGKAANSLNIDRNEGYAQRMDAKLASSKDTRASNETAKFLASKGREDLAKAILAGSITGKQAFAQYKQEEATEKARNASFEDQSRLARLRASLRPKAVNTNDAKFCLLARMGIKPESDEGKQFLLGIKPSAASSKSMRPATAAEIAEYKKAFNIGDDEPVGAYLQVDEIGQLHIDGQRSGTNVSVNVDTKGQPEKLLNSADNEIIKAQAKSGFSPIPIDSNDPAKGLQRDDRGELKFEPTPGSAAEIDAATVALEAVKRNHSRTKQMLVDNETILSNGQKVLDILVGSDPQNPKYDKTTLQRIATLDPPEAGVRGAAMANLKFFSSQEAVNVEEALTPIRTTVAFDRLQRMRDASKTGGALGQVSNIELNLLINSMESLNNRLDPPQLAENVRRIMRVYTEIINDPISAAILAAKTPEEAERLIRAFEVQQQSAGPPEGTNTFNVNGGVATITPRN